MENPIPSPSSGKRILVAATGSIATPSLPSYLGALRARLDVTCTVLLTPAATAFLSPQTAALFAERVVSGESPDDWPTANRPGWRPTTTSCWCCLRRRTRLPWPPRGPPPTASAQ
nr:flavoprotein [Streptomyces sp. Termitarium-T10T-6]